MIIRRLLCGLVLGAFLVGCEDEEEPELTCAVAVDLSGTVTAKLTHESSVGCATPFSLDEGFEVDYVPTADGDLARFELVVDAVKSGETGTGFAATVRVTHADKTNYTAACTVEVETHESRGPVEFGESFRVTGKGECPAPATRSDGPGEVTIAPFTFIAVVTWG